MQVDLVNISLCNIYYLKEKHNLASVQKLVSTTV